MSDFRFYEQGVTQVLTACFVALHGAEKQLKDCNETISRAEFVACGGFLKKGNVKPCPITLLQMCGYAKRGIRKLAKKEIVFIEPKKGPATKQVDKHIQNTAAFLSDLPYYDASDMEDVAEKEIQYVNSDDDNEHEDDDVDGAEDKEEDGAEDKEEDGAEDKEDDGAENQRGDSDNEDFEDKSESDGSDESDSNDSNDSNNSDSDDSSDEENDSSDEQNDSECVD
jgi:hypothetical protein